jgi:hypothetical protein
MDKKFFVTHEQLVFYSKQRSRSGREESPTSILG